MNRAAPVNARISRRLQKLFGSRRRPAASPSSIHVLQVVRTFSTLHLHATTAGPPPPGGTSAIATSSSGLQIPITVGMSDTALSIRVPLEAFAAHRGEHRWSFAIITPNGSLPLERHGQPLTMPLSVMAPAPGLLVRARVTTNRSGRLVVTTATWEAPT